MQLTRYTDYALRALLYLGAHPGEIVPAPAIARAYRISPDHVAKATKALTRVGILRATRGSAGGVELARPPARIRIGTVVRMLEGEARLVECFDPEHSRCPLTGACRLAGALAEAQAAFFTTLDAYTLEDLLENKAELARHLVPVRSLVARKREVSRRA
jgi:Rrf2 family nitric oxide-sensitive transcriptional repressor